MKKFPITSADGNEYLIKIKPYVFVDNYKATLYKKVKLLGITFNKKLRYNYYNGSEWDYDFIKMAKRQVCLYEESLIKNQYNKMKLKEGRSDFEKWDGNIK